ncbi:MAG TPA: VOC family metalloprotein YjdN [Gemmataceae bacterium]|jgi:PhnB protein|nr:VOC family metalloprotein YjdN [Gemmataceae bacterium]
MQVQPYLNFDGRCEEAIAFYQKALGAEVIMKMHFKDMPKQEGQEGCPGGPTPGTENKVMHAELQIGKSVVLLSDGRCEGKTNFHGVALSIDLDDVAKCEKVFAALSEGGQVNMPLGQTFFAKSFGMLQDKFGVGWMVIVRR